MQRFAVTAHGLDMSPGAMACSWRVSCSLDAPAGLETSSIFAVTSGLKQGSRRSADAAADERASAIVAYQVPYGVRQGVDGLARVQGRFL
jgi:hypothetical protein